MAIDSVEDMKILFDGIPLEKMSVSMTMKRRGAAGARRRSSSPAKSRASARTSSTGPSRTTSSRSSWSATPTSIRRPRACGSCRTSSSTRRTTCRGSTRSPSPATTCRRPRRSATQELAFTIADGLEYVRFALDRGLDVDRFAGRLSFFFAIGMDFFMEIAKLRAARLLWHRVMSQFEPKNPKSLMLRTHCQTSGVSLTALDPYNNVIRTTVEALAAVLGGTSRCTRTRSTRRSASRPTSPPASPATPTGAPRGDRRPPRRRPARRLVLRREADQRPRRSGLGADRGGGRGSSAA